MGADRGQPDAPSWLYPDGTTPDAGTPGREWYPGTEWYPGEEYRPPRYGEPRHRAPAHRAAGEPGRPHQVRNGMLIGLGCLIVIAGIGIGLTGEKFPASSPRSHPSARHSAAAAPVAARPKSRPRAAKNGPRPILTYRVTGTPGARVTYGPAGTYLTGRAPLQVTARLGNPLYYFITVQLSRRGSVECEILIGTKVMAESAATGRHNNLASCQISRDPLSRKWQDAGGG